MQDKIYHKQREKTRDSLEEVISKGVEIDQLPEYMKNFYKSYQSTSKRQANRQMMWADTPGKMKSIMSNKQIKRYGMY